MSLRPYTTHYYASTTHALSDYAAQGHASSEVGAVRASVVWMSRGYDVPIPEGEAVDR